MVDSSDFEAFFEQEKAKAARVLPPSSSYGLTTAPSRHLIFAKEEEQRLMAGNFETESAEAESTLQAASMLPHQNLAFVGRGTGGARNEGIDTFRGNPYLINEGSSHKILSRPVNSAHSGDDPGTKTTFFESPYWPGSQPFVSRGLLDSNSSAQKSLPRKSIDDASSM